MQRRHLLTLLALSATPAAWAQPAPQWTVIKLLSYDCPVCFAYEAHDTFLEQRLTSKKTRFVKAPIVSLKEDDGAKARVFYASRKLGPAYSSAVASALYKGAQGNGLPLNDFPSTYTWLEQELIKTPEDATRLSALFTDAQSPESRAALDRALTIAYNVGVNAIPAYVILSPDNTPVAMFDPTSAPGGPAALREALLKKLDELQTATPPSKNP